MKSTFIANTAPHNGASIYSSNALTTTASVFTHIGAVTGCYSSGSITSGGYNVDGDATCTGSAPSPGDISDGTDPLLGALADNGGPTQTMLPSAASPLIDAVPWVTCEGLLGGDTDQRGINRGLSGADVDGCDIGAVEVADMTQVFDIITAGGTVTLEGAYCYEDEAAVAVGDLPTPPAGVSVPFGGLSFSACTFAGDTIDVTLTLSSPVNAAYKVTTGWVTIPGAVFNGSDVTYSITDNDGNLDEDDTAGYITDPVAPAIGATFTG